MIENKSSYKFGRFIKSALSAAMLPVFIIYIMIAKPDYVIMNNLAHVILPIAHGVGSVITWPVRSVGHVIDWVKETSTLRTENRELREKLDIAMANKNECDIAISENKKLEKEINIQKLSPYKTVIADIQIDNSAFHHSTFLVNRGKKHGLSKGMVVVSFDNRLVGIISDCGSQFCRVRALTDTDTNIAVRITGSDVYGFLQGKGHTGASIGFFNDVQFIGRKGLKVVTSNISGILPSGIYIGEMINDNNVDVLKPNQVSRVMILEFNELGYHK